MSRLVSALTVLIAAAATGIAWFQSHSWWMTTLAGLICALIGFGKKVWSKLEPQWTDRVAGAVDRYVTTWFAGYPKRYAEHLYYKHRTFDVKGFSTQGKFALELETVYVDLSVDPAVAGSIPQDPIRLPSGETQGHRDMFAWLNADPARPRNFAIVGPPGSGKTTLLKHLALVTAARRGPLKLTPVLLFLRDHSAAIGANPDVKLPELVGTSIKDQPPPPGWFEDRLRRGTCLVMFDGLDEVADPQLRCKVVKWVEDQVGIFGKNRFLISSRPNGYRDNPLAGFTVLRVLPFSRDQVERFIRNWYLANELVAYQKDDPGVRMEADRGATDLLARLRGSPTLQELAVNPLLLTLIATVHRYRSELPGRRVELFAEICDVFLGKRQLARGLELGLTPAQKVRVLRVLAYEMMRRQIREIPASEAAGVISETLKLVTPAAEPLEFLRAVEDSSALLLQREGGVYGFAHLTFQEYLASLHIKEEKLVAELTARVDQTWWHETARLYAAQADATPIVEQCLASDHPAAEALLLAADCESEALQLRADLRERLRRITDEAIEDPEPERRRLAADYMLARRLRNMIRIDDDRYLDTAPVTHAEYQLFIDDMRARGEYRQPDHWDNYEFPRGSGRSPIVGIRIDDAETFCRWLGQKRPGDWILSLPETKDLALECANGRWRHLQFFTRDCTPEFAMLSGEQILDRLRNDSKLLAQPGTSPVLIRSARRFIWFYHWLNSARYLPPDRARDRALARALDRDRYRVLDLDRALAAYMLNRLCIVEKRAEGNLPVVEGLWLARVRERRENPEQPTAAGRH